MNILQAKTTWIETSERLKNVLKLLENYPDDLQLRDEKQRLEKKIGEMQEKLNIGELIKCPFCDAPLNVFGKFKDYRCAVCERFFTKEKLEELGVL